METNIRIDRAIERYRRWDEAKHPRDKIGQFASTSALGDSRSQTGSYERRIEDWHEPSYPDVPTIDWNHVPPVYEGGDDEVDHTTRWMFAQADTRQNANFDTPHQINFFRAQMRKHNKKLEQIRQRVIRGIVKSDNKRQDILDQIGKMLDEWEKMPIDATEERLAIMRRVKKTHNLGQKAIQSQIKAREKVLEDLPKLIGATHPVAVLIPGSSNAETCQGIAAARQWLSGMVSSKTVSNAQEDGIPLWVVQGTDIAENRSHAIPGSDNSSHMLALAPAASPQTVIHEIGHTIEFGNKMVQRMASGFLYHRVGQERPAKMHQDAWDDYRPEEVGWKDDWGAAFGSDARYVGKFYPDGWTEVVSMGMQALYNNPHKFALSDPEHFKLTVGILRGDFS